MLAYVRSEYGSPDVLRLEEVPRPTPVDREVLVRVHAASVNMADVDYLMGRPKVARLITGPRRPRNASLGLDLAGRVEEVGDQVTRLKPGDEVFGDLTEFGFGAFAEFACAPEAAFAPKPEGLTFEEAAAVPQAAVMAAQGLRGKRSVQPGFNVLVNGAGGNIGPFAVQIAKHLGAEVTGVDVTDKLDFIRSIGADHVIDYTVDDYTMMDARYDWVLDVASHRSIFELRRVLRPNGVYVIVPASIPGMFRAIVLGPLVSALGSKKVGNLRWKPFEAEQVAFLTDLLEKRDVSPVIDRTYGFDEIPDALRYQADGSAKGKIIISR